MIVLGCAQAGLAGLFGLLCCLFLVGGVVASASTYRGTEGEAYSFRNHSISDLGEMGVAPLARVFNITLMAGALCLMLFSIFLGLAMRQNVWAKAASAVAFAAAAFLAMVGVFPKNYRDKHNFVALWFFRLGLAMIALFTIAIFAQGPDARILPDGINWAGALSVAAFVSFLFVVPRLEKKSVAAFEPETLDLRPALRWMVVAEWSIYFTTILWILAVSIALVA